MNINFSVAELFLDYSESYILRRSKGRISSAIAAQHQHEVALFLKRYYYDICHRGVVHGIGETCDALGH